MRVTGNTSNWEFKVWQAGIYAETPPVIDHTIRGMALEGDRLSILMADCGDDLVPPGDDRGPGAAPRRLHRRHGGDARALPGLARRPRAAGPVPSLALLRARDDRARARGGRRAGPDRGRPPGLGAAPRAGASPPRAGPWRCTATPSRSATRCGPRRSPSSAGDWKLGNVGHRPDGRTILLDWAYPGEAPPCWDLTWYLALNRARLPESKEATIARYRERLEAHGVDTADWWDRQLGLSLVGMAAVFAWEKAVGDQDELDWWERAALRRGRGGCDRCRIGYAGMAEAWADGPALAYGPMARHLVDQGAGAAAADRGRWTPAPARASPATRCEHAAPAWSRPTASSTWRRTTPRPAGGDGGRDRVAVPAPAASTSWSRRSSSTTCPTRVAGLAELRRVTRPGGALLASTFSDDRAAAKEAVDAVAAGYGFVAPQWYADLQECAHDRPRRGRVRARARGRRVRRLDRHRGAGSTSGSSRQGVVRYRLGMPHLHRFAAGLPDDVRAAFFADAVEAVRRTGERFAPLVIEAGRAMAPRGRDPQPRVAANRPERRAVARPPRGPRARPAARPSARA